MRDTPRLLAAVLLLAAAGLGACSNDDGPETNPLTAQNADAVGSAAASTADLALAAIQPSVPNFGGGFPLFFANGRSIAGGLTFSPPGVIPDCPAASDQTDTDGDGVPDNATWTFSAANCTETDIEGNRSVVTGSVVIGDPGLTAGYDLHLNDLTGAYYENGATTPALQLILDGDWALRGTSDALSLDQDYSFVLTVQGKRATLSNDLAVNFAATGGPIAWGAPLPDGTLSIDGAWQLASSRENYHLVLFTLQPLVYDDACGGFVGGVLQATGEGGEVQTTWTACGVHTSTFIAD